MEITKSLQSVYRILFSVLFCSFTLILSAHESRNCALTGRWAEGNCNAVASVGDTVFYANGGILNILDNTDPELPVKLGEIVLPGVIHDIVLRDRYAYIADAESGMRIVDVSDPAVPIEVGYYDSVFFSLDIAIRDTLAFVADDEGGLRILNIADPSAPEQLAVYSSPGNVRAVKLKDDYAYIAYRWSGMCVVDFSDPEAPSEVACIEIEDVAEGLTIVEDTVYLANGREGLRIINVADPSVPEEIGFFDAVDFVYDVVIRDTLAFLADRYDGIRILNIANHNSVAEVDNLHMQRSVKLSLSESMAYLANMWNGLAVVDISNPEDLELANKFETADYSENVVVQDTLAYVANRYQGLYIVDVSDPTSPVTLSRMDIPAANNLAVAGNYIYALNSDILYIINVSDHLVPEVADVITYPFSSKSIAIDGELMFLGTSDTGVYIFDISNPELPDPLSSALSGYEVTDLMVADTLLYLACEDSGMLILNISDPALPGEVGGLTTSDASGIFVQDTLAFLADGGWGLRIIDISDPEAPGQIGRWDNSGVIVNDVTISGNYAFVADEYYGLRIVDVGNPETPVEEGYYRTGRWAESICFANGQLYLANARAGFYIFRHALDQSITFGALADMIYGDADLAPGAAASSGLAVSYSTSDPLVATIISNQIHAVAPGTVTIYADQAGDDTYTAAPQISQSLTITAKELTVAGATAANKVYDGTTDAVISGATLNGVVDSDDVSLTNSTSGTFASADTGTVISVTTAMTLSGDDSGKYTLVQPELTADITAAELEITADAQTKVEGTEDPDLTYALTAGRLVPGENLSGELTREAGETPGTYAILLGTLTAGSNYTIGFVSADLTITPATSVFSNFIEGLKVYPVPAGPLVTISANETLKKVEVFDISGNIQLSRIVNNTNLILDLSDLNQGMYILKITTGNAQHFARLFKQ